MPKKNKLGVTFVKSGVTNCCYSKEALLEKKP